MDYKGRPKESGEFCSASQRILSYVRAGEPVPCLDGVVLDLKDGKYADFMYCVGAPRVESENKTEAGEGQGQGSLTHLSFEVPKHFGSAKVLTFFYMANF